MRRFLKQRPHKAKTEAESGDQKTGDQSTDTDSKVDEQAGKNSKTKDSRTAETKIQEKGAKEGTGKDGSAGAAAPAGASSSAIATAAGDVGGAAAGVGGDEEGKEADLPKPKQHRARVLAYSDSDSDVESYRQEVKVLIPPKKDRAVAEGADGGSVQGEGAEAEAEAPTTAAPGDLPANEAVAQAEAIDAAGALRGAVGTVTAQLTPMVALNAGALLLLRRLHARGAGVAEAAGLGLQIGLAAARALVRL